MKNLKIIFLMFGILHSMQNCTMFLGLRKKFQNGVNEFFQELCSFNIQDARVSRIMNEEVQPTELDDLKEFFGFLLAGCFVQECFERNHQLNNQSRQPIPRNISSLEEARLQKENQESENFHHAAKGAQTRVTFISGSQSSLNSSEQKLQEELSSSDFQRIGSHEEQDENVDPSKKTSTPLGWVLINRPVQ